MALKSATTKVRFPAITRISVQFGLLVSLIITIVLGSLVVLNWQQKRGLDRLLESETKERVETLQDIVEHLQHELEVFTRNWAQREEMANFVAQPKIPWIQSSLIPALTARRVNRAWVGRANGETLFDSTAGRAGAYGPAPTTLEEVTRLHPDQQSGTFSRRSADGTEEISYALIQREADPRPLGLLLIARTLNSERSQELGTVLRGIVTLGSESHGTPRGLGNITAEIPLRGLDGGVVDSLVLNTTAPEFNLLLRQRNDLRTVVVITFLISGLIACAITYRLIIHPINQITQSLKTQSSGPITELLERPDEIGALASLVAESFARKRELEQLLERRVQLGRELHDTVIQTVYAAGLNLSSAAALCRTEPARAAEMLEATGRELNHTIRELRTFIGELEPEEGAEQPFGDAVSSIVKLITAAHRIDVTLKIATEAIAALGRNQRLQMLRIIRESVSNVVRHAHASLVTVEFYRLGNKGTLVVRDNGDGFDPLRVERGHGLINLSARAADLGGSCEVNSTVGRGTVVTVSFPIRPDAV